MKRTGRIRDLGAGMLLGGLALFVGGVFPLLTLLGLVRDAWPAMEKFGLSFFVTTTWDPVQEIFGALPAITGTLLTTALSALIAFPISLGIAIFITELSPRILRPLWTTAVELLGTIPSIIYGMWGLFVIAPIMANHVEPFLQQTLGPIPGVGALFAGPPLGIDVLTASFILSIMIIPYMATVIKDAFEMVPDAIKEASYGLGATQWETVVGAVIPTAFPGIVAGFILGVGRALGETMAVAFLTGNVHQIPRSLLDPLTTITVAIANEFTEADTDVYLGALFYLALVLFLVSFLLMYLAKEIVFLRIRKRFEGQ